MNVLAKKFTLPKSGEKVWIIIFCKFFLRLREKLGRLRHHYRKILEEKFDEIILFGSYARGDNTEYSDVDLVLVVKEALSHTEKKKLTDVLSQYSLKYDIVLSCIDYPKTLFENYKTPFLSNVKEEEIRI